MILEVNLSANEIRCGRVRKKSRKCKIQVLPLLHNLFDAYITFCMKNKENFVLDLKDLLKATLLSLLFSLIFVLIFALIIRWASVPDNVIVPVNYVIKFLSLLLGAMIGFKNRKNGILKGAILGLLFMLLTFVVFQAMDGFKDIRFNWIDLICLPIGGAILGVIKVNLPTKRA